MRGQKSNSEVATPKIFITHLMIGKAWPEDNSKLPPPKFTYTHLTIRKPWSSERLSKNKSMFTPNTAQFFSLLSTNHSRSPSCRPFQLATPSYFHRGQQVFLEWLGSFWTSLSGSVKTSFLILGSPQCHIRTDNALRVVVILPRKQPLDTLPFCFIQCRSWKIWQKIWWPKFC